MKVTFILTIREKNFLIALNNKKKNQGQGTGMMCDDAFNKRWKKEIRTFSNNHLTKKKDGGYGYWRYGLNTKGLKLQKQVVKERK